MAGSVLGSGQRFEAEKPNWLRTLSVEINDLANAVAAEQGGRHEVTRCVEL